MTKTVEKEDITPDIEAFSLTREEYEEIKRRLNRTPSELELHLFSAMWSEHCGYKHSKKYLSALPSAGALFRQENSGGIKIGRHIVFFKTESHNHPSAVEPYQGAATGIGGILRDILAMNARPIALLNSLKFGPIANFGESDENSVNRNRYLLNGVVEGISDYGNSVGVPTIGGEVSFNPCYNLSPLVNVMAVGICKEKKVKTAAAKEKSLIVLIGSKTGRDGLNGAAFASKELENDDSDRLSVQIGDPYTKKKVIEATLEILKSPNVFSCQDLGAAGLLSSTSEAAEKGNVSIELHLDKVPLREKSMLPHEIMLSESQERMIFCCNEDGAREIDKICKKYEIESTIIGKTSKGTLYKLFWGEKELCSLDIKTLVNPIVYDLHPIEPPNSKENLEIPNKDAELTAEYVYKLLKTPDFASKRYVYSQYDYTVGARTLKDPHCTGVAPLYIPEEGLTIGFSMDSNESASSINPYNAAFNLVYEAARNAWSSGFEPLGITNCLNFANPEKREVAYQFLETVKGMREALLSLKIPVVSGNVSFYNEGETKTGKIKIHPTPVIGTLSLLKTKEPIYARVLEGDTLFCIGKQINSESDIGASLYLKAFWGFEGGKIDKTDIKLEEKLKNVIFTLKNKKLLHGAIDVSKGGILGAILIMSCNSRDEIGLNCKIERHLRLALGEITGRYLISGKGGEIENYLIKNKIPYKKLGNATTDGILNLGAEKFDMKEIKEFYFNSLQKNL